jgi:hypothetical protein
MMGVSSYAWDHDKCIQNFHRKTARDDITWENWI